MKSWTAADKAEAWRLYQRHTTAAIAEILGRDKAQVKELIVNIKFGREPMPSVDLSILSEAERADYRTFREHKFTPDQAFEKVIRWAVRVKS